MKKCLVLILVLALVFSGCGKSTSKEKEKTNVTMALSQDTQMAAVAIVADKAGYFKEQGLTVDISYFASGADLTSAVASGSCDFGSGGDTPTSILLASDPGSYIVIARQAYVSGTQAMIVNPDVIKTPEDLNGKKIAYSTGNTSEFLWLSIVEKYGLDTSTMELFTMGATEMVTAFDRGDIDAYVCWEPNIISGESVGGTRFISGAGTYYSGQFEEDDIIGAYCLFFTSSDYAKKNPETTKKVLTALNKAVSFIEKDFDTAAEYVSKELSIDLEQCKTMMNLNKYSLELSSEMIDDLKSTGEFLVKVGKLDKCPDYDNLVVTDYLKEVDSSLVNTK